MRFVPHSASTISNEVDWITFGLLALSAVILMTVFLLMTVFIVKYRRKPGAVDPNRYQPRSKRRPYLEIGWMVILFGISLVFFAWGGWTYFKMHRPPDGSVEIYVVGKQWMWKFQHTDGTRELSQLHVPVGVPIKLIMTSQDVIHSFFVPAFRIKQDVLPGRYSETWFQATHAGEYDLFCTQYCGTSHAKMRAKVIVLEPAQFSAWKASGSPLAMSATSDLASAGARHFTRLGCISCHAPNSPVRAPDLHGIFGKKEGLRTGDSVFVDESYLRESILLPNAKIVQGYDAIMPSFQGQVSEEELTELVAYLKTLGGAGRPGNSAP